MKKKRLTILHSNDLHGDFLAEEIDEELVGGVSRLSGYVSKVRQELANTIYCIAGDMFRGSVIDSEYKGVSTIEIMNMLSPDVVTVGNHEVDYGLAHMLFLEKCANFPVINANMRVSTNHSRLFRPYYIKRIGGMKILFIGILTEEVLAMTRVGDGIVGTIVEVNDAVEEVKRICGAYRTSDVDLTILLTHIGYEKDKELAEKLDPELGVDIIIGGHSHTLLTEPTVINDIYIVQAGVGTDQIGRFDLVVDRDNKCIDSCTWKSIPITERTCPRDEELERLIYYYKNETDKKYNRVLTRFVKTLTHPSRIQETNLGNLVADAFKEQMGLDIMLAASGSIRSAELGPIVMYADLLAAFPYDDALHRFAVTGEQLKRMIGYMLRDETWMEGSHTEFYQLSEGMRVVYDRASGTFTEFSYQGEEIPPDRIFHVGLQGYHFVNMEEIFHIPMEDVLKNEEPEKLADSCRSVLEEYLSNHQLIRSEVEGRIQVI